MSCTQRIKGDSIRMTLNNIDIDNDIDHWIIGVRFLMVGRVISNYVSVFREWEINQKSHSC